MSHLQGSKLKLLDVGALELNYTKQTKWIDAVAIDLNPQVVGIVKADFLQFQVGYLLIVIVAYNTSHPYYMIQFNSIS